MSLRAERRMKWAPRWLEWEMKEVPAVASQVHGWGGRAGRGAGQPACPPSLLGLRALCFWEECLETYPWLRGSSGLKATCSGFPGESSVVLTYQLFQRAARTPFVRERRRAQIPEAFRAQACSNEAQCGLGPRIPLLTLSPPAWLA